MEKLHPSTNQNVMGEDDQIRQAVVADKICRDRRGVSVFSRSSSRGRPRRPIRQSSTMDQRPLSIARNQLSTGHNAVISRERMVSAAVTIMSTGLSATVDRLINILTNAPHSLPDTVAEGNVIGARFAASSVSSWRQDLSSFCGNGLPADRSVCAALKWWYREPRFNLPAPRPLSPEALVVRMRNSPQGLCLRCQVTTLWSSHRNDPPSGRDSEVERSDESVVELDQAVSVSRKRKKTRKRREG